MLLLSRSQFNVQSLRKFTNLKNTYYCRHFDRQTLSGKSLKQEQVNQREDLCSKSMKRNTTK